VEKISAQLNLDMISRNDPDSIYLIGSRILSSGLDEALRHVNAQDTRLGFDYAYEDPRHPDRFFFRSDHYPYIQYGIPAVWLFCGTTEDYHQETDTVSRVDFEKMARITRLAFASILYIGNLTDLLALDVHPEITTRGAHNTRITWR
jgi:Zn-dependent M28 family amino/carboxypeptidase